MKDVLSAIRRGEDGTIVLGNHPAIVQSVLDFDFLSGKERPSILCLVSGARRAQKFFFGEREFLLPCFSSIAAIPAALKGRVRWVLNAQSGRRAHESTAQFFETFPAAFGGTIFAENVPERHAADLIQRFGATKLIAGPASVGILIPGKLKLGAIGGIGPAQIAQGALTESGKVAVVSTSGGMTNELITAVARAGKRVSFSVALGGDRFPATSLGEVLALAEGDPETSAVVYFGELGGTDEYEIVDLLKKKKLTKQVVAYIAGAIDEAFDEHLQFGHAKALVVRKDESARAKREALREAGAKAPDTFPEFLEELGGLAHPLVRGTVVDTHTLMNRQASILSTREIVDLDSALEFVKSGKLVRRGENQFARAALRALLEREPSEQFAAFTENVFELLIDHGGHVSGAVNTMIAARAGKDMVSSLASGLLTVGPRFGGAINAAARAWREAVAGGESALAFVERHSKAGRLIAGIGHRKYRVGIPDPRVAALSQFSTLLKKHPHYDFAREVEKLTTKKSGSLILNVDGVIAALALDLLAEKEKYSDGEIVELLDAEFFNALFVVPRTVGFIAHFMEQKRTDEGLFRLPDELLFVRKREGAKKSARRRG